MKQNKGVLKGRLSSVDRMALRIGYNVLDVRSALRCQSIQLHASLIQLSEGELVFHVLNAENLHKETLLSVFSGKSLLDDDGDSSDDEYDFDRLEVSRKKKPSYIG